MKQALVVLTCFVLIACHNKSNKIEFSSVLNTDTVKKETQIQIMHEKTQTENVPPISVITEKDTLKIIDLKLLINNIDYNLRLFLQNKNVVQEFEQTQKRYSKDPKNSEEYFSAIENYVAFYKCDSVECSQSDKFTKELSEALIKRGMFRINMNDTIHDYNNNWVGLDTEKTLYDFLPFFLVIDINRDGFMDLLVTDIQGENTANSVTDFWIYSKTEKALKHIESLTTPVWKIKVDQKETFISTGWHMSSSEGNSNSFYLKDTLPSNSQ